MTLTLPKEFAQWARAEVAAGRAESVEQLARAALGAHQRRVESLRASLDAAVAEADLDGWIEGEAFLAETDALIDELEREGGPSAAT